jgi:hypothetical protein
MDFIAHTVVVLELQLLEILKVFHELEELVPDIVAYSFVRPLVSLHGGCSGHLFLHKRLDLLVVIFNLPLRDVDVIFDYFQFLLHFPEVILSRILAKDAYFSLDFGQFPQRILDRLDFTLIFFDILLSNPHLVPNLGKHVLSHDIKCLFLQIFNFDPVGLDPDSTTILEVSKHFFEFRDSFTQWHEDRRVKRSSIRVTFGICWMMDLSAFL